MMKAELDLAERLTLAYQGRQSFQEADKILDLLHFEEKTEMQACLGRKKAEAGLEPQPHLDFLLQRRAEIQPQTRPWRERSYEAASIYLRMGNADAAWLLISEDQYWGRPGQPETGLEIARIRIKQGRNPQPVLERTLNSSGQIINGFNKLKGRIDSTFQIFDLTSIAPIYREAGQNPEPLLSLARTVCLKKGVGENGFGPAHLAEIYAEFGELGTALDILDGIEKRKGEEDSYFKISAIKRIARDLLVKGKTEDALEVTFRARENLFTSRIMAEAAAEAGGNQDVDLWLNLALDFAYRPLRLYRVNGGRLAPDDYDLKTQAELMSIIGRVTSARGRDATAYFQRSLELMGQLEDDIAIKANAYHPIAQNIELTGLDSIPVWRLAMSTAERFLNSTPRTEYLDLDLAEYCIYMEELAQTLVTEGHYNLAWEAVHKSSTLEGFPNLNFNGELWADIGAHQIRSGGLSQPQIDNLTPTQIREIVSKRDAIVQKAVEYFGLGKKVG